MKQVIKYILKERGINALIAYKRMYTKHSDNAFSLYDSIKMSLSHKRDKEDILYRLMWELSMVKDFAQYQN